MDYLQEDGLLLSINDWYDKGLTPPRTLGSVVLSTNSLERLEDNHYNTSFRTRTINVRNLFDNSRVSDLTKIVKQVMFEQFNFTNYTGTNMPEVGSKIFNYSLVLDLKHAGVPEEFMEYLIGSETRQELITYFWNMLNHQFSAKLESDLFLGWFDDNAVFAYLE